MQINAKEIINLLLTGRLSLMDFPPKESINPENKTDRQLPPKENNTLTLPLHKKTLVQVPLKEVLKELGIKVTEENLLILEKLITAKKSLSPKKIQLASQLINEYPLIKEELLELLFNPFCHLILFNEEEKEKASFYVKEEKDKNEIEVTILFQHPKTEDILIKIHWSIQPVINMYFNNERIKELFTEKIKQLQEQLEIKCFFNCYYEPQIIRTNKKFNYYKLDLKI